MTTPGRVFAVNWSLEKTIPLSPLKPHMPITTRTTALSTSAIPTVMLPITTVLPVNTAPPITTAPPINPPVIPVPLPQWQSHMAPHFDPKNPSTLCMYLSDYESLAKSVQLTPAECLSQSTCYPTEEDKD